jgi:hypothetical protein
MHRCFQVLHTLFSRSAGSLRLKCDGTRAENRFRLSAKRTSPFKSAGASVQSTTGTRGVRISGSNAGYTIFRGSVKSTGYPLHSTVSPSLPLPVRHRVPSHFNWTLPPDLEVLPVVPVVLTVQTLPDVVTPSVTDTSSAPEWTSWYLRSKKHRSKCLEHSVSRVSEFAYKRCSVDGRWEGRRSGVFTSPQGWTNYTPCFTPEMLQLIRKLYAGSEDTANVRAVKQNRAWRSTRNSIRQQWRVRGR